MRLLRRLLLTGMLAALCCAALTAQQWELGGGVGYGVYRNGSIIAPAGQVTAGLRNRFAVTAWLDEDMYEHLSGELRYVYHDGDPFLEAGAVQTNLQGQSHTLTYDVLIHFRSRMASVRPYVAVGAGIKDYVVTGPFNPNQPFQRIGVLSATDELKFAASAGAGVALILGSHVDIRIDFRDYMTKFPKKIIVPVALATGRGIIHQFTPMVGIGYRF